MNLVPALSKSIIQNHPEFRSLSAKQQKKIIKKTFQHAVKKSLIKIQLPNPKNQIIQAIEKWRYEHRHSDKYRKRVKLTDYYFVESLRKLREPDVKNTITDFESEFDETGKNSLEKGPMKFSTNRTIQSKEYDYSSFSGNRIISKHKLFKSEIDPDVFSSNTKLRNHITHSKYRLETSLLEMVTASKDSIRFNEKNPEKNRTYVSKSLFQLYELNLFAIFIKKLENQVKLHYEKKFQKELPQCYEILYHYYSKWLGYYGKELKSLSEIESELLLNDEFMALNEENPLIEGFTMLSCSSIDFGKIKSLLDEKMLKTVFLIKNTNN